MGADGSIYICSSDEDAEDTLKPSLKGSDQVEWGSTTIEPVGGSARDNRKRRTKATVSTVYCSGLRSAPQNGGLSDEVEGGLYLHSRQETR